ncbi:DUF3221 domain-containing protein [Rossellomorea sp. YZS02]|uniref:DUF3221 domain-containing protein n=1 Tax=Rossellomorea sp. YZS02 TaxID=3097358 RepID=UPI002A134390|nr:DUF3221 domain-containing protein [Rossellomorea sp. YZS02]MDX8343150.1 DUF3221 domain-containing protein [Rossellomorea sp. YZS02]
MKNHLKYTIMITMFLSLTACGTDTTVDRSNGEDQTQSAMPENDSGWKTIETVSKRSIIAKLEQSVQETPKWNQTVQGIKEGKDFQKGQFGKPTDELAEELAIQTVVGKAVMPLLEEIYGGYQGLDEAGVVFSESKSMGAEQSGFWIGIKRPDDRLEKVLTEMQKKVDAGEIKAKYLFIFYTPYTTAENNALMNKVNEKVRAIAKNHETPDRLAGEVSVDTVTGNIQIGHNFLTEDQKSNLVDSFPNRKVVFHQQGRLVPKKGEKETTYPKEKYTDELSKDGGYVMSLSEEGMLLVSAKASDYSENGGVNEYYSATHYSFPDASKKLKVGQRVNVEASGPIMESYPGKGKALYVDVLPEYKPSHADLTESEVVQLGIEKAKSDKDKHILAIRDISYNEDDDQWLVVFVRDKEVIEIIFPDEEK